jgi:hypothetical protein
LIHLSEFHVKFHVNFGFHTRVLCFSRYYENLKRKTRKIPFRHIFFEKKNSAKIVPRYYENLKPKCVDEGVSFEERAAAREAEIQSLREALDMLQPQGTA